jgi:hypothetical protein
MGAAKKREDWPGSHPTGKVRKFQVTVTKTVDIAIDESVIAQGLLPDNPIFGHDTTEHQVIEHIAFNVVGNQLRLSQIDGYANCPDEGAKELGGYTAFDVEFDEIPADTSRPKPKARR